MDRVFRMSRTRVALTTALLLALTLVSLSAAQTTGGTVSGVVTGPSGPLAGAVVRVRNLDTGNALETRSAADGSYVLQVPAGSYDFFASLASYAGHIQRGLEVQSGAALRVDATLREGPNFGIPGENGFLLLGTAQTPPTGPAPRTANGGPDLSGVWFPSDDVDPEVPPYKPWARTLAEQRAAEFGKDDPRSLCLPTGVARTMRFDLTKVIQTPELLVILIEGSPPGFRQIFLDGRGHPADLQPSWMGHSVGRWDGDTLVVDTVGFNDRGWVNSGGQPQTEELHVTERFRRTGLGRMDVDITIDDPGAYERPWKMRRSLTLAPGEEIHEYVCNENLKREHMVGSGTR